MKTVPHWIGGKPFGDAAGASGTWGPVTDPATGEVTTQVAMAAADEVDAAVAAAKEAYAVWRTSSLAQRIAILFRYRELLNARRDDLAALITAEQGKVHADALGEVARGLEIVELACGLGMALKGDTSTEVSSHVDVASVRQPLGVIVGISPFNFPAMISMWMFPMAIACGNTFVHKPSSKAPSASMLLAELAAEAGVPDGVLNIVHGDEVAVNALLDHPDVAAVSFVGSTPVARHVYSRASASGKRVQALGGAKNHMLVLPDADLDAAADAAVTAAYGSAGQRCMAVSVVVAVGSAGDALVSRIAERATKVKIGPGNDPTSEMGPLVTKAHRDEVANYVGARPPREPTWCSTAGTSPSRASRTGTGWVFRSSTTSAPIRTPTGTRSSAPSCACSARGPTTRPCASSTAPRSATPARSSPATAARPAGSSWRSRPAWSA